jgi:hypothetical protein
VLEALTYRIRATKRDPQENARLRALRAALMDSSEPPIVDLQAIRWWRAYSLGVASEDDAREARARRPGARPELTDPLTRTVEQDVALGRMYRMIRDNDAALPLLERGARSCNTLDAPFETTWALSELARLYQDVGRRDEACRSYSAVERRWGDEPRSISGAVAKSALASLKCSPSATLSTIEPFTKRGMR